MSALTLTPRALYEEVAEQLRQRIFRRELEPGSWVDELKIAEEFGISHTPLREALKVLAAEGLITMKVRRGAYVTEVSDKDLSDVYHLLSLLESDAVAVVAERASDDQLKELERLHQELEAAGRDPERQRERFFQINEQFHMRLLDIANNRLSANSIEPRGAIGSYDVSDGTYLLYTSSQNPHGARQMLAANVFHIASQKSGELNNHR